MRMGSSSAISRRAVMRFARGFYSGNVRSKVNVTPAGRWHIIYLLARNGAQRVIGQGVSWEAAYMNLRANLPTKIEQVSKKMPDGTTLTANVQVTDWQALDAAVRS